MLLKMLTVFAVCVCGASAAAAEDAPFAEYRVQRSLGTILITTGYVERLPDLQVRAPALEADGIVILETEAARTFARRDTVASRLVETTITILPPVGHGEGGASSSATIRVVVEGDTLLDCPLFNGPTSLDKISIDPGRRFVSLIASSGILHFDGFEGRRAIDADWLDERAVAVKKLLCEPPTRPKARG
jgi:hypothetical protein